MALWSHSVLHLKVSIIAHLVVFCIERFDGTLCNFLAGSTRFSISTVWCYFLVQIKTSKHNDSTVLTWGQAGWPWLNKSCLFLYSVNMIKGHTCCKITVLLIIYRFTPFLLKDHILRLQWHLQQLQLKSFLFCFLFLNFRLKFCVIVKDIH